MSISENFAQSDGQGEEDFEAQPVDEIHLDTIGIDVGSATTHFLVSHLTLRRLGAALTSRYEVVNRREVFRSPILLTPYMSSTAIDGDALSEFFTTMIGRSGFGYDEIDTGVVILTGEAARKHNARTVMEVFADQAGKFVCTSAGHHLEARMAAYGSGAVARSRKRASVVVNLDVGGGTMKFTLLSAGRICGTAALNVGGRLVATDPEGRLERVDATATRVMEETGSDLRLGEVLPEASTRDLCSRLADCVVEYLTTSAPYSSLTRDLMLTADLGDLSRAEEVVVSGGVSEYLVNPEATADDNGPWLARALRERAAQVGLKLRPASERMRATVIGLSQFTTQLSGDTVYVSSTSVLPVRNLRVVQIPVSEAAEASAEHVAGAVRKALASTGPGDQIQDVVLDVDWAGRPYFPVLRAIAEGLAAGAKDLEQSTLVVVLSQDCARSLGYLLHEAVGDARQIVCVDGLQLRVHDFIDVGSPVQNDRVVPVVVKTLVFPDVDGSGHDAAPGTYSEKHGQILTESTR